MAHAYIVDTEVALFVGLIVTVQSTAKCTQMYICASTYNLHLPAVYKRQCSQPISSWLVALFLISLEKRERRYVTVRLKPFISVATVPSVILPQCLLCLFICLNCHFVLLHCLNHWKNKDTWAVIQSSKIRLSAFYCTFLTVVFHPVIVCFL